MIRFALVAFAVVGLGFAARAAELKLVDGARRSLGGSPDSRVGAKPMKKLSKEPAYKSAKPVYLSLALGKGAGRYVIGAFDESGGTGKGYDKLYLDANNNGDLTDDAAPAVKVNNRGAMVMFTVAKTTLTVKYDDASKRKLNMTVIAYKYRRPRMTKDTWYVRYNILQHLEGSVEFGTRKYRVALYDMATRTVRANGCFDDYGIDQLWIDLNDNGTFERTEQMLLGKVFALSGKLWALSVNGSGSKFALKPYSGPTGAIKISTKYSDASWVTGGKLSLISKGGCAVAVDLSKPGTVKVPADSFRLTSGQINIKDKDGGNWTLRISGSNPVKVGADSTAEIELGGACKVQPLVNGRLKAGSRVSISHKVIGAAGESYDSIVKNGRNRVAAPKVKIADAKGRVLAQGAMQYG
jgi:hypothetical protein